MTTRSKPRPRKPRGWIGKQGDAIVFVGSNVTLSLYGGSFTGEYPTHRTIAREIGKRLVQWAAWAEAKHGSKK